MTDFVKQRGCKTRELLRKFVSKSISFVEFDDAFSAIWRDGTRNEESIRAGWTRRYDLELQASLANGQISQQQFASQWNLLWGVTEDDQAIESVLSSVYSAIDHWSAASPIPSSQESNLHQEFQSHLLALERVLDDTAS